MADGSMLITVAPNGARMTKKEHSNNLFLPDGTLAPDNAALVENTAEQALLLGRSLGDKLFAESLF